MAYYLYARDVLKRRLRVSTTKAELGEESQALKQMVLHRWSIQKAINQSTNRLHQLVIETFPEGEAEYFDQLLKIIPVYPTPRAILEESNNLAEFKGMRKNSKADILSLAGETVGVPGEHFERSITTIAVQRQDLVAKLDEITQKLEIMVAEHPYGKILTSFPQMGTVSAATLIAVIKDINLYPNDRKLQKTLGCAPGVKVQSGQKNGKNKGKLKKVYSGSNDARRVIYQNIYGCINPKAKPNDARDLYQKLKEKGRAGPSAIMRCSVVLCEQIYYCLSNGVFYEYQGGKQKCQSYASPDGSDVSLCGCQPGSE
jgi:hypothetical protein